MKETILVSAFPGCGKSHFFKNTKLVTLDSDSSKFDKAHFPENYIKHIKSNLGKVDIIFISSHQEVRDALNDNNLEYMLVYPDPSLKEEYLERYNKRGSGKAFIKLLDEKWNLWMKGLENDPTPYKYILNEGEYLSHAINEDNF